MPVVGKKGWVPPATSVSPSSLALGVKRAGGQACSNPALRALRRAPRRLEPLFVGSGAFGLGGAVVR